MSSYGMRGSAWTAPDRSELWEHGTLSSLTYQQTLATASTSNSTGRRVTSGPFEADHNRRVTEGRLRWSTTATLNVSTSTSEQRREESNGRQSDTIMSLSYVSKIKRLFKLKVFIFIPKAVCSVNYARWGDRSWPRACSAEATLLITSPASSSPSPTPSGQTEKQTLLVSQTKTPAPTRHLARKYLMLTGKCPRHWRRDTWEAFKTLWYIIVSF